MVPMEIHDLRGVAFILGYTVEGTGRMLEDYRRTTRRARKVFDRLFYGAVDDAV